MQKIEQLQSVQRNAIQLEGYDKRYRVRVGKYRIIYAMDKQTLDIVKIDKRSRVYD